MNTRISAIATSVYVLVTVMPKYSRSILSSILQGKPRPGKTGAGPYTENGTQCPGLVYSEVNTLLIIDASGICELSIFTEKFQAAWIFTISSKNTIHR